MCPPGQEQGLSFMQEQVGGQTQHCPLAGKESTFQQVGLARSGLQNRLGGAALSQGCLARGRGAQGCQGATGTWGAASNTDGGREALAGSLTGRKWPIVQVGPLSPRLRIPGAPGPALPPQTPAGKVTSGCALSQVPQEEEVAPGRQRRGAGKGGGVWKRKGAPGGEKNAGERRRGRGRKGCSRERG